MQPYYLRRDNIWIIPVLHYNIETAALTHLLLSAVQPDAVAVELAETMQSQFLDAARRLPDVSLVASHTMDGAALLYLSAASDAAFEGLRWSLEQGAAGYCIDLDVDYYPYQEEALPDPYAISRIGQEKYFQSYYHYKRPSSPVDQDRENHMTRRLRELSLRHAKVVCICGMAHAGEVYELLKNNSYPMLLAAPRDNIKLYSLSEESLREVLPDNAYYLSRYEQWRCSTVDEIPDRQKMLLSLYREAAEKYKKKDGLFAGYHLRNMMRYCRNYALVKGRLTADLFQLLTAAKGCVDNNYAYEVWKLATSYPYQRNVDNLEEVTISAEQLWGASKKIRFKLLDKNEKASFQRRLRKDQRHWTFAPSTPSGFCSYQPEDFAVENFSLHLQKKGRQLLFDESARSIPFSSSLEDGIDARETIRHWPEHKLYVKVRGKPPGAVGSVVVVFDPDYEQEQHGFGKSYPWCTTWHGEHHQESDMAFYATPLNEQIVGPGICRCQYGGIMMTYPPRRVYDVWQDADYLVCRSKPEVLLMAAIDYSTAPNIAYVAANPPTSWLKSYARRFGKKVVYIPYGQLSPVTLRRLRSFHVLDSHGRRQSAGDYIF